MAKKIRVGFIGTGRPYNTTGSTGYGMAYEHARGYKALPDVELAACADLKKENGNAFAEHNGVKTVYTDYNKMLKLEKLDMVSICTWPHLHAPMALAAIKAGVKAVHCEKPMAFTWGESVQMAAAAKKRGCRLTFNHQRRFGEPFQKALQIVKSGKIGKTLRLEAFPPNLYDWGTHWLDMLNMWNGESRAKWVIGQLDARTEVRVYGAPMENQGIWQVLYENGVHGLISTGSELGQGAALRVIGEQGVVEIDWHEPILRVLTKGEWEIIPVKENLHGPGYVERAIADAVKALRNGTVSQLCAENALVSTEIIFAAYESSRRRGRVDMPLTAKDNPLEAMIQKGMIEPKPKPKKGK